MKKKIIVKAMLLMGLCCLAPQVVNANTNCLQVPNVSDEPTVTDSVTKTTTTHKTDGTIEIVTITITIYSDGTIVETKTTHVTHAPNTGLSH